MEKADLRIRDGHIEELGQGLEAQPGETVEDLEGRLVLPGLVNAHTHLYSSLARGMPAPREAPRNFLEILQKVWWRLDRALDEESIYCSALVGAIEAVKAGTTTLVDHHASPNCIPGSLDLIRDALRQVGVRGVLCYEVTDRNGKAGRDAGLRENQRFLEEGADSHFRGLVGGHASFTLADDSLRACAELAQDGDTGVHLHLAEDPCDARISRENYGRLNMVTAFEEMGMLGPKSVFAHGVHLTDAQIDRLKVSGAWLVHNPRSNMNNGVGYAPLHRFGPHTALGTDGFPADMFQEAAFGFFKAQDAAAGRPRLAPDDFLRLLQSGQEMISQMFGEAFGTLQKGAPADLVILRYQAPTPLTADNMAAHLLFGIKSDQITDVMVDGRFIVRGGEVTTVDIQQEFSKAWAAARRLWDRMEV